MVFTPFIVKDMSPPTVNIAIASTRQENPGLLKGSGVDLTRSIIIEAAKTAVEGPSPQVMRKVKPSLCACVEGSWTRYMKGAERMKRREKAKRLLANFPP